MLSRTPKKCFVWRKMSKPILCFPHVLHALAVFIHTKPDPLYAIIASRSAQPNYTHVQLHTNKSRSAWPQTHQHTTRRHAKCLINYEPNLSFARTAHACTITRAVNMVFVEIGTISARHKHRSTHFPPSPNRRDPSRRDTPRENSPRRCTHHGIANCRALMWFQVIRLWVCFGRFSAAPWIKSSAHAGSDEATFSAVAERGWACLSSISIYRVSQRLCNDFFYYSSFKFKHRFLCFYWFIWFLVVAS